MLEFDNLLMLIKTVSSSELTSFSMKEGDMKISMGKDKKIYVTSGEGTTVIPGTASPSQLLIPGAAASGNMRGNQTEEDHAAEQEINQNAVKAPLVGTFYSASAPDAEPFVKVGDQVKKGQTLGIIEAMKLMNEIECETDGTVEAILVENGQMVEYGQPLFVIK